MEPECNERRIYRAEVVGSLLRPPELVHARNDMRTGKLAPEAYARIEDRAVQHALKLQKEAGLDVVTDGEMRRDVFFDFLVTGLTGLSMLPGIAVKFHGHTEEAAMQVQIPFSVTEKISARECPGVREFKYAAAHSDMPIKVTLPSPMMILGLWNDHSKAAYPDPFLLAADAAEAVASWMRQLAAAGCTYIQIDAPELNEAYVDARVRADYEQRGISSERFLAVGTELLGSLADIKLAGVTKALHVCRGNGTQSWIAEGGYEEFSRVVFRRASGFDIFHLEYDDDRSGSFEPLRHLPKDKVAVLGLVSTKWTRMESHEELAGRIREAARFHPLNQLALATQCGFASAAETAADRRITDATQLAKLRVVAEVAHDIWH